MIRLLIVDDEDDLCEILSFNFEAEGYGVDTAPSAERAMELIGEGRHYDLMLLDVMMSGLSGYDMASRLRAGGDNTPVVFITARDAHDDQMRGFEVGADDYITKPFSFDTVLARVRAVLRRSVPAIASGAAGLTKREHLILQLLQQHPGRYFSREEILAAVWPDDSYVSERTVDVHIARLRKKMGADGNRIVNKTGFGYGLV